jgi:N-acetylated-alpha-linked acidic dipeptidase
MEDLRGKAVAYINSDSNSRGFLDVGGSHSLETFVNQALADVQDPVKKVGVLQRARAQAILEGAADSRKDARAHHGLAIAALGSGSDFTPFLQHAGVASLNVGYGGEDEYGQYHSIYDSFDHYLRFMDPDFAYGVTLARTVGRLTLRLAQADTIPMDFGPMVAVLETYVKEVRALADRQREETDLRRRDLDEGLYAALFPPNETRVAPVRQDPVPHLNLTPLENALDRVRKAVAGYDAAREARSGKPLDRGRARELDTILRGTERALTRSEGLPGRPWYRHQIYAPGLYTGYGVKTLPAVREAIELRNWSEAEAQAVLVGRTLEGFAEQIERATAVLSLP